MRTCTTVIGLVSMIVLAVLALVLIPRLLRPEQVFTRTYWPTQGWRTSAPEEQGFDSSRLSEGLQAVQRFEGQIENP